MNTHARRPLAALALAALLGAVGGVAGCDQYDQRSNPSTTTPPNPAPAPSTPRATTTPDADNTARNKNDVEPAAKTPMDQGQTAPDVKITAEIRRAIMEGKDMSMNAQNCKIITDKGMVTLRGPVDTQAEKDRIDAIAKGVAGVTSVDNQLEVKAK